MSMPECHSVYVSFVSALLVSVICVCPVCECSLRKNPFLESSCMFTFFSSDIPWECLRQALRAISWLQNITGEHPVLRQQACVVDG